jgi:methyltransferase (TIGR00027 family)
MCLVRAASYKEKRECYAGPDYIAYRLIPAFLKLTVRSKRLFKIFTQRFFSKGIYEYVIARTKYFDTAFATALEENFDQIVIFGAGFDSRAIRFENFNNGTIVFELDVPATQNEKLKAYQTKKIPIPKNLVFVSIDFNKELLESKIAQAGFVAGRRTLFLLEGITMYLSPIAVENTFRFLSSVSCSGCVVVFDHIYKGVLRGENKYYGEEGMYQKVAKSGENWTFAFDEDEVEPFLRKYGFKIKDRNGSLALEDKYFKNSEGTILGKISGIHEIVTAIRT